MNRFNEEWLTLFLFMSVMSAKKEVLQKFGEIALARKHNAFLPFDLERTLSLITIPSLSLDWDNECMLRLHVPNGDFQNCTSSFL